MNFREVYYQLKATVFNMENKTEKQKVENMFNRLIDDVDQYVIMSDMFPSLVIDANLPRDVIKKELISYAKMHVFDEFGRIVI